MLLLFQKTCFQVQLESSDFLLKEIFWPLCGCKVVMHQHCSRTAATSDQIQRDNRGQRHQERNANAETSSQERNCWKWESALTASGWCSEMSLSERKDPKKKKKNNSVQKKLPKTEQLHRWQSMMEKKSTHRDNTAHSTRRWRRQQRGRADVRNTIYRIAPHESRVWDGGGSTHRRWCLSEQEAVICKTNISISCSFLSSANNHSKIRGTKS